VLILGIKLDFFSLNFFFSCLIFLVCESRIGFLLFILYIRIESELVKKTKVGTILIFLLIFNLEIFGISYLFVILKDSLYLDEEFNLFLKSRDVNFAIVLLVIILYLIVLIIPIYYKFRLNLIFLLLLYLIIVRDFVVFFYLYEMIFILIMFSIIILGYSYERMIASFLIIFYSFLFSRPILVILLLFDHRFLIKNWLRYSIIFNYFLVGSFMVKFPIFGFHY
jgi:hypothetical protein